MADADSQSAIALYQSGNKDAYHDHVEGLRDAVVHAQDIAALQKILVNLNADPIDEEAAHEIADSVLARALTLLGGALNMDEEITRLISEYDDVDKWYS